MARLVNATAGSCLSYPAGIITTHPLTFACMVYPVGDVWNSVISIGTNGSNNNRVTLGLQDLANGGATIMQTRTNANAIATATASYIPGQWNHIAGVCYDAWNKAAFMNGGNKGTDNINRFPGPGNLIYSYIGNNMGLGSWDGRIAEVGIWDVALTDQELFILSLGVSPMRVRPGNLRHYAPLIGGNPEPDYSGLAQNFTLVNSPAYADHAPVTSSFFSIPNIGIPTALPPASFSDDFDAYADNQDLDTTGNWVTVQGEPEAYQGKAYASAINDNWCRINQASFPDDQFVEADWTSKLNEAPAVGICLRCATDGSNTFYMAEIYQNTLKLYKRVNGAWTELDNQTHSLESGRLRFEAEGDQLRAYLNGNLTAQATDSAIAAGVPGMYWWQSSGNYSLDNFSAGEFMAGDQTVTVADAGSGIDAPAGLSVSLALADAGAGSDTLPGTAAALGLGESGSGSDGLAQLLAALSLAETGAGSDALQSLAASLALAETAGGADVLAGILAVLTLQDAGAGVDAISLLAEALKLIADTGSGADALSLAAALAVAETGSGADGVSIGVEITVADAGGGAEAVNVLAEGIKLIQETAAGLDGLSVSVAPLLVADTAAGADQTAVTAQLTIQDAGSGASALSLLVSVLKQVAETAAGGDSVGQISVSLSLAEAGAGADLIGALAAALVVVEQATGADGVLQFDSAVKLVTITFTFARRRVDFSLARRAVEFSLAQRSITFALNTEA